MTAQALLLMFRGPLQVALGLLIVCGMARDARAECVPVQKARAPKKVTSGNRTLALGRYKLGNELLAKGDYDGALGLFLQSRELWPNRSNTKNAAICFFELGRYPEALAFYEELTGRFAADLDDEESALVAKVITDLRQKVLIANIEEPTGTFSIDDESCGSLPRAEPVYLMPGSHIFHVLRLGQPEFLAEFSGKAGTRISVKLPKPPEPPPPPPDVGGWFVRTSVGPAIAWPGIGTVATGVVVQGYGGYRLPNGIMLGLNVGWLQVSSSLFVDQSFGTFRYEGTYEQLFRASFGGLSAGWGTRVRERFDVWFRGGFGLMSPQSQHVFRAGGIFSGSKEKVLSVDVSGSQVIRSVSPYLISDAEHLIPFDEYPIPKYANVEVGGALPVGLFRIGLTVGGLLILNDGPPLPTLYVGPHRDPNPVDCPVDAKEPHCLPTLVWGHQRSYSSLGFILLPQLVIGF